ncbi:MAG: lactate dehydrogenase [Chloroflexi bacterium]|nr:lactate dehydrogenase [Chloroflexota bacterium]
MPRQVVVLGEIARMTSMGLPPDRFEALAAAAGGAVEIKWVDPEQAPEDIVRESRDALAIIPAGGNRALTTEHVRQLPNLKLIQTISAGTDWLDKAALGELGVLVANNGGANRVAVAEHAITLMVAVCRKLDHQIRSARERKWWDDVPGQLGEYHTLDGKTIGIIGLGRIGKAVAQRLRGWECDIIYHDVLDMGPQIERELNISRVPMDELLARSDLVTLHVPLERTTHHMIGRRELRLMKSTAFLINTCRGPVVNEAALIEALRAGEIAAAGLDVLDQEPTPVDNPLLDMANVIVTPHTAWKAIESMLVGGQFAVENVSRLARGEEPTSVVPPT